MQLLNGVYTQRFNRTAKRSGHVYRGRFKSILVNKDTYLLELARYVVLNPARANMVRSDGSGARSCSLTSTDLQARSRPFRCGIGRPRHPSVRDERSPDLRQLPVHVLHPPDPAVLVGGRS
jgi:hypothetical protein